MTPDLLIIGAGPAGIAAAIRARAAGLDVLVIDENPAAGGQVYRAPDAAARPMANGPDFAAGERRRAALAASGATLISGHRVWHVSRELEVAMIGPDGPVQAQARTLIAATGAIERIYPFEGWTEPGVVGLAAATIMLKGHKLLPGRRVLVAGPGPLGPLVASQIMAGGGTVAGLIDPNPLSAWLAALPRMACQPRLAMRGAGWIAQLRMRGTSVHHGWGVRRAERSGDALLVTIAPVDPDWRFRPGMNERQFLVDALCVGHGLTPNGALARMLDLEMAFDAERGGWHPRVDAFGRTSHPMVFAAGDGAGFRGAAAAEAAGTLAALAIAEALEAIDRDVLAREAAPVLRRHQRAARFGAAMARMMRPRSQIMETVSDRTILCRCEDLTAGMLRAAVDEGATEINALKAATRCGMGPCGGRTCGDAVSALMQTRGHTPAAIGQLNARSPLAPLPIAELTGEFAYADIPIPEPSPA